jgi:arsenate reductase (thioredoxin)
LLIKAGHNYFEGKIMIQKSTPKTVLFLCTGNSCRSQMAEELVNHYLAGDWQAFSAGVVPAGYVHPLAIQVLSELGIDHKGRSKSVKEFYGQKFDQVITVCSDADQNCPVWLGEGKKTHIGFPDPAQAQGTDEEKLVVFRSVRDDMRGRILDYLNAV